MEVRLPHLRLVALSHGITIASEFAVGKPCRTTGLVPAGFQWRWTALLFVAFTVEFHVCCLLNVQRFSVLFVEIELCRQADCLPLKQPYYFVHGFGVSSSSMPCIFFLFMSCRLAPPRPTSIVRSFFVCFDTADYDYVYHTGPAELEPNSRITLGLGSIVSAVEVQVGRRKAMLWRWGRTY